MALNMSNQEFWVAEPVYSVLLCVLPKIIADVGWNQTISGTGVVNMFAGNDLHEVTIH